MSAGAARERRDAFIASAYNRGLGLTEIAAAVGVSHTTVARRLKALGVEMRPAGRPRGIPNPPDPVMIDRAASMVALFRAGQTLQQIGDAYGITRERVRQILAKAGVKSDEGGAAKRVAEERAKKRAAREQACRRKWGISLSEYRRFQKIGREIVRAGGSLAKTPIGAFLQQRRSAAQRGIAFEMTFGEWWSVWEDSGRWEERGRGQGYVMCRKGDQGPYALGNVFIATAAENSSTGPHKKSDLPMGVSIRRLGEPRPYMANRCIGGRTYYLGSFRTPEEAHAAYLRCTEPPNDESEKQKPRSDLPTGVTLIKKNGRYKARVTVDGRSKHIGCFGTAEEAQRAYLRAARHRPYPSGSASPDDAAMAPAAE